MKTIDQKIKETIKLVRPKFAQSIKLEEFEKTSRTFDVLVKKGVIKKRGNNLLSVSDAHLEEQFSFNLKS